MSATITSVRFRGATWKHVLAIDEQTGVVDLVMDPENPEVLYAAAWNKTRYKMGGILMPFCAWLLNWSRCIPPPETSTQLKPSTETHSFDAGRISPIAGVLLSR